MRGWCKLFSTVPWQPLKHAEFSTVIITEDEKDEEMVCHVSIDIVDSKFG